MPFVRWTACAGAIAAALLSAAEPARAAPPTKEECVDAHARGQDAREAGQLVRASKLFLLCIDAACPDLVRNDCARFTDEVERLRPSVSFAARDGAQHDLPDTAVYVDGALAAPRLGDGKVYDLDPGRHEVRFLHAGTEVTLAIVVSQGEKARPLVATFGVPTPAPPPPPAGDEAPPKAPPQAPPEPKRPSGPLVLVGLGAAAAVAGGVMAGVGVMRLPSNCNLWTHACAALPGAPVFDQASRSATLIDLGAVVGGAGIVAMGGALIGYFAQTPRPPRTAVQLAPWIAGRGAGVSLGGVF
jgi:hypothetical protein